MARARRQGGSLPKLLTSSNGTRIFLAALCLLSRLAFADAPAPDPEAIVIKVGDIALTMGQVTEAFHEAAQADTSTLRADTESVDRFLDSYVGILLRESLAMRDSTLITPSGRWAMELNEEGHLTEALQGYYTAHHLATDETTLRAVYDRMETELRLATIKVPTFVDLDSVRSAIAAGRQFSDVARRWSKDTRSRHAGGDLGWLDPLKFSPSVQSILWSLPVGVVSEPIPERAFHSLYVVLARRQAPPRRSFEEEKEKILRGIALTQLSDVAREMHDELMAKYHYRVDDQAAEWLRDFLQRETASARRTYDPNVDKPYAYLDRPTDPRFWKEAPLKGEEARRPVALMDGDTLTALGVIDQPVFMPTLVWPRFESVNDVHDLCDEAIYERVRIREARSLGLDKEPAVARRIAQYRRFAYWRAYRAEYILPQIRPSDDEIAELYTKRIEQFRIPERRRFVAMGLPEIDLARRARQGLQDGLAPSTIIKEIYTPGLTIAATPDTGLGLLPYGKTPRFDDVIFHLDEGQVSEPLPDGGAFSVIRVDAIMPARTQPLEEVRGELESEIIAPRERKAVAELVERARADTPVWVDRETIQRIDFRPSVFAARGNGN